MSLQTVAEARRDIGLARVEMSAGMPWVERAAGLVRAYALKHGKFLVEDVRAAAAEWEMIEDPPNAKAWGAAVQLARRRGWVNACGYAPANSSNRSPKVLWEAVR
jgi:hypothetical protein